MCTFGFRVNPRLVHTHTHNHRFVDDCKTETLRRGNNFGSTALLFRRKRLATIKAAYQGEKNKDGCVHLWYVSM